MKKLLFAAILTLAAIGCFGQVVVDNVALGRPYSDFEPDLTKWLSPDRHSHLDIKGVCYGFFYRGCEMYVYVTPKSETVYAIERRYTVPITDYGRLEMGYTKLSKWAAKFGRHKPEREGENFPDLEWEIPGGSAKLTALYVGGRYFVRLLITDEKSLNLLFEEGGTTIIAGMPE